ncbi:MAG TPA: AgmX/PglI C-terminal domain-containing protein [Kofleriaceae bacterium]
MRFVLLILLAGCPGAGKSTTPMTGGTRGLGEIEFTELESAEDLEGANRSYDQNNDTVLNVGSGAPLDRDKIRQVVRRNAHRIQGCYDKHPGKAGVVRVQFTIDPEGKVSEATARGIHRDIEGCLETTFRQFLFPPPPSNVQVTYPFAFAARGGA